MDEIKYIRDRYGLIYFSIRDDTFTADRERAIDFCRLLLAERVFVVWNCQSRVNYVDEELLGWLKRAGCECVQLGVETGSPRLLRELGKAIRPEQTIRAADAVRRVGLNLSIYLITGIPGETDLELQETLAAQIYDRVRYRVETADAGRMLVAGRAYEPRSRLDAEARGVRMVMQELNLIGNLTVGMISPKPATFSAVMAIRS